MICDSPAIRPGRLGLIARPNQAAGKPPAQATATSGVAAQAIKDGKQILKDLEPQIRLLRFKLTHQFPSTVAFCNKHFATGRSKVTSSEIDFINRLVGAIHFHVARFNIFGIQLIENIILFDPKDTTHGGWTVRGGDKLSTKQFQIYVERGKTIKAPGQSVFLTDLWVSAFIGFEKHLAVLHEMAHFVGPLTGPASRSTITLRRLRSSFCPSRNFRSSTTQRPFLSSFSKPASEPQALWRCRGWPQMQPTSTLSRKSRPLATS